MLMRVLQRNRVLCGGGGGGRYLIQGLAYIVTVAEAHLSPASWRTREGLGIAQSETEGPGARSTKV